MTPWLRRLAPTYRASAVHRLTPEVLRAWHLDALMLDLDNTLVGWGERTPPEPVALWLRALREAGIPACLVSNSLSARARAVAVTLQLPVARGRMKPSVTKLQDGLRILATPPPRTAMVGDQMLTDVLAGNRLGVPTVLTVPLAPDEPLRVRLVRVAEQRLLAVMIRRGLVAPQADV